MTPKLCISQDDGIWLPLHRLGLPSRPPSPGTLKYPSDISRLTSSWEQTVGEFFIHYFYLKIWVFLQFFVTSLFACLQSRKLPWWLMFGSKDRVRKMTSVTVILSPHWIASCSCRLCVKMYKCVFSAFKQWSQQNFLNVFDLMKPICSFPPRISLFQLYLTLME